MTLIYAEIEMKKEKSNKFIEKRPGYISSNFREKLS
jgi:hypothetical protein